jgi:hypothetical protein
MHDSLTREDINDPSVIATRFNSKIINIKIEESQ